MAKVLDTVGVMGTSANIHNEAFLQRIINRFQSFLFRAGIFNRFLHFSVVAAMIN